MTMPRYAMGLTTLPNGSVLAVGGQGGGGQTLRSAELFDPDNNTWTQIPMLSLASPRAGLGLATLPDGRVIAAGGVTDSGAEAVESVELFGNFRYDLYPVWATAAPPRYQMCRAVLPVQRVHVSGFEFFFSLHVVDIRTAPSKSCADRVPAI